MSLRFVIVLYSGTKENRTCVNECQATFAILYIYGCFMFQCWMLFLDLEVMDIEFLKFHVYLSQVLMKILKMFANRKD